MKNKAISALIEMGMPADLKGFQYIVNAMVLFEEDEWRNGKTTTLYYKIGKQNGTTASHVERAIRYAFGVVLAKDNREAVKKYLPVQNVTNGNLLHTFYLKLTMEDEKREFKKEALDD